jgi:uncharacterized surface protein with fasciclin (FAS1) repeats
MNSLKAFALVIPFVFAACASQQETETKQDIVGVAVTAGQFTTLVEALQAAELVDTLRSPGPFTVFAPTDAAFAKLPEGTVETLLNPDNRDQLVAVLTYHVVSGEISSGDMADQVAMVKTIEGSKLLVDTKNGAKVDTANIVSADVEASNGIIHVIDTVLLPPSAFARP